MIPKIIKSTNLQLISPCYCAGANQQEAELRAASFRGELRWWFRCLGGTRKMESAVFGGGDAPGTASAVALLVRNIQAKPKFSWVPDQPKPNNKYNSDSDTPYYITYFLDKRKTAFLPPGLKFTLELRQLREISADAKELLLLAWDCLCNLGAIGARKTRALGAFAPVDPKEQKIPALIKNPKVTNKRFLIEYYDDIDYGAFTDPQAIIEVLSDCATWLKDYRQTYNMHPAKYGKGHSKENPGISVFGNAIGGRQCSAVRFRPVLVNNKFRICIFKAPDITLCEQAKKHNITTLQL